MIKREAVRFLILYFIYGFPFALTYAPEVAGGKTGYFFELG